MAQLQEELWGKDSFKAKVRMGDIDENQFKRIIDILFQIRKELSPEDRVLQIKARLKDLPETFSFETLLEDCDNIHEYVITFIAILDMAKDHYLTFSIDDNENIWFKRGSNHD